MILLAEIGDKMWSVQDMFVFALVLAFSSSVLELVRWWLAAPALILAAYGNHALWMECMLPACGRLSGTNSAGPG